ncbi:hypothetical protein BJI67_08895 [Acidihalobacter aeolianus]|uniref:RND efflux pump membrane fusion protein barrel-sandwich domain-containing protein n=1 Tax=Acidihalobacter aeolianus TaxID=2792603 RepID=A0A1D8K872_9GAMM|nr:efflux RND transporter periplasmic adaptor subunit [Acidihalobacter aeolianus]AOV17163.1 hypothetical protein BJI67_08895 [Acidihalobacter aeolianus]
MPASRAKRWIPLLVLLLLAVAIALATQISPWARILPWVKPVNASAGLTLYGNIDLREIRLAFNDNGRIASLQAQDGQTVHKGDLLGILDDTRYRIAYVHAQALVQEAAAHLDDLLAGTRPEDIDRLRAEVSAAESQLRLRRATYERILRLERQKASPPQDLDSARAALQAAQAQLQALKASLRLAIAGPRQGTIAAARAALSAAKAGAALARRELEDTRLLAPADAIVRTRILEPGDMASPAQPVYALALMNPLWVRAYVDEINLGKLHPGQGAWVTTDSFPGTRFKAWVGYISSSAEFTPKSVETPQLRTSLVYQVRIYVCNPQNKLRLGMPATVHIQPSATPTHPRPSCQ